MTKDKTKKEKKEKKGSIGKEKNEDLKFSGDAGSPSGPDTQSEGTQAPGDGKPSDHPEKEEQAGQPTGGKPDQSSPAAGSGEKKARESAGEDSVVSKLQKKLEETEGKRDEYLSLAQRVQADFDNYKRRNKSATADSYRSATADVVEAFLPVLDNLERAMDSVPDSDAEASVRKGVEMVKKQFLDTLSRLDVEEIEALGKPFDPAFHNAVGQVDGEEGQEENTVAEVLQKGYKMGDKVIRYSMVHVVR